MLRYRVFQTYLSLRYLTRTDQINHMQIVNHNMHLHTHLFLHTVIHFVEESIIMQECINLHYFTHISAGCFSVTGSICFPSETKKPLIKLIHISIKAINYFWQRWFNISHRPDQL